MKKLTDWMQWMRQWEGPLTEDLRLSPSPLGKLPQRLLPEKTTRMVCGFCSTGCRLNVHWKEGAAVNLTPDADYPVNRGKACPKGWEALTPLKAADRATTPYLRNAQGVLEAVSWETALKIFTQRFPCCPD